MHVPKCAGKSLCASLFGDWDPGHRSLNWYARVFPEFHARAFKFAIVRDPLERAYSAYCYLLGTSPYEQDQAMRRMLERYDGFDDFVDAWLCPENLERQIHFVPQWRFLTDELGQIGMDFVGRYEKSARRFRADLRTARPPGRTGAQEQVAAQERERRTRAIQGSDAEKNPRGVCARLPLAGVHAPD
ncbi:sulfotransferase family 2 domain-containing protein [Azotobacter vinelandii]